MAYPPGSGTTGPRRDPCAVGEGAGQPRPLRAGAAAADADQRRHRPDVDAAKDGAGARAQVVRRQPDGSWLRVLDQPEFVPPEG